MTFIFLIDIEITVLSSYKCSNIWTYHSLFIQFLLLSTVVISHSIAKYAVMKSPCSHLFPLFLIAALR